MHSWVKLYLTCHELGVTDMEYPWMLNSMLPAVLLHGGLEEGMWSLSEQMTYFVQGTRKMPQQCSEDWN